MKALAITLLTLATTATQAATYIKIPLFIEQNHQLYSAAELNKKFNLQGQNKLLENLVITNTKTSIDAAHKAYWDLFRQVENIKINPDISLANDFPGGNNIKGVRTCYIGNPAEAVDIASSMADSIYSDQLGITGCKYKNTMQVSDTSDENAEEINYLNENVPEWRNWNTKSNDILIVSHESDDGDDTNAGIIVPCNQ
jgi:hypothetical protein